MIYRLIKNEGGLKQNSLEFSLYVREVQGRELLDVVVKKRTADRSGFELVAFARTATLAVVYRPPGMPGGDSSLSAAVGAANGHEQADSAAKPASADRTEPKPFWTTPGTHELVLRLYHCEVVSLNGQSASEVECFEIATRLPDAMFGKNTKGRPSGQTWRELFEYRAEVMQTHADLAKKADALEEQAKQHSGAEARALRDEALVTRGGGMRYAARLLRGMNTEIQMRPALAVSCLCFALVGCPVGIRASRADYLSVFVICFLPTIFIYYPILIGTLKMSNDGTVHPLTTWTANVVGFVASFVLVKWLMKR